MIRLSNNLSEQVRKELKIKDDSVNEFYLDDLRTVSCLSVSRDDMDYIQYFENVSVLELDLFPSVTSEDILYIGQTIPTIFSLKIKEQNSIYRLDLSTFTNLKELAVIHNDNLVDICGLSELSRFTFYDNKEYKNTKQLVDYVEENPDIKYTFDFLYYVEFKRLLSNPKMVDKMSWVESTGLRSFHTHEFTKTEIKSLIGYVSDIVSKYTFVHDDAITKFSVLYAWMNANIKFVNEDDDETANLDRMNNTYRVFSYATGGRLSYAKAFQFLLTFAGIDSTVVYSYGALDKIGYYNGEKVFSLLGTSDYALLRVNLEGKNYYCDVAWDSLIKDFKYFDALRLFLVSKEELQQRHKFVGEGNVLNSYSYHGDDSEELTARMKRRIEEVSKFFNMIEDYDSRLKALEINRLVCMSNIESIINKRDPEEEFKYQEELNDLNNSLNRDLDKYNDLLKEQKEFIKSNADYLRKNYLENKNATDEELWRYLTKRQNEFKISKYLYDILIQL